MPSGPRKFCGAPPLCFSFLLQGTKVLLLHGLFYDCHVWKAAMLYMQYIYPNAFSKTDWRFGPGSRSTNNKIPVKVL